MDKKNLKKIPRPIVEDSFYPLAKEEKSRYIVTAERVEEVLVINFFQVSGKNFQDISPEFRTFCQKNSYISQDLTSEKVKWKTASVMYQCNSWSGYPKYWWSASGIKVARGEEIIIASINEFLEKKGDWKNSMNAIEEYQDSILKRKLEIKHKKETDVIDEQMKKFGDIPDDYQEFTEKRLFADANYMFYNKAKKRAYCSKCGWDFDIDSTGHLSNKIGIWNKESSIRHNQVIRCPYCNTYEEAKSEKMSRVPLTSIQWSVLVQKNGEEVLVRYFCHVKDFKDDFRKPNYFRSEQFRTIHSADNSKDYEWGEFKHTGNRRWIVQREGGYGFYWSPSELVLPRSVTLYNTNLNKTLEDTCMKYSCAEEYLDYIAEQMKDQRFHCSPWIVDQYLNYYRKNPSVEQLIKCNLVPLMYEIQHDYRHEKALKEGTTICEILGITKNELKILRKQKPAKYRDIEIMQYYREVHKREVPEKDFVELKYIQDDGYASFYKYFIDAMKYSTLHKIRRYVAKNVKYAKDYFDYLEWLEPLEYDVKNEFNLFPKDFVKAHDEKSKEYQKLQDKKHKEEIRKFNVLLKKLRSEIKEDDPLNIKTLGLFIRLPKTLDELKIEGENLHHCVGTYRDKVAKGETLIYFVRKQDEPEKSYFTLEWKGKVVQCRGFRNCDMTPEVKAFVQLFSDKMNEYAEKPKKQRKVG